MLSKRGGGSGAGGGAGGGAGAVCRRGRGRAEATLLGVRERRHLDGRADRGRRSARPRARESARLSLPLRLFRGGARLRVGRRAVAAAHLVRRVLVAGAGVRRLRRPPRLALLRRRGRRRRRRRHPILGAHPRPPRRGSGRTRRNRLIRHFRCTSVATDRPLWHPTANERPFIFCKGRFKSCKTGFKNWKRRSRGHLGGDPARRRSGVRRLRPPRRPHERDRRPRRDGGRHPLQPLRRPRGAARRAARAAPPRAARPPRRRARRRQRRLPRAPHPRRAGVLRLLHRAPPLLLHPPRRRDRRLRRHARGDLPPPRAPGPPRRARRLAARRSRAGDRDADGDAARAQDARLLHPRQRADLRREAGRFLLPRRRVKPTNKWLVTISVTFGTLMGTIDASIVNVAVPHLRGAVGATIEEITWVTTGFALANVLVMPLTGFLGRLFGQKRLYMFCLVLFVFGSALCGMARSLTTLVAFRVLQGFGAGALQPTEQAILRQTFPPEEQGMAMAVFGMAVLIGPAVGPTLGGYIVDHYSWPWIFYINIPVGALALFMVNRFVHEPEDITAANRAMAVKQRKHMDWDGIVLLCVGL